MLQTIKTPTQVKMIPCSKCYSAMPELRKTQFGYDFCVKCSDGLNLVGKKRALPVQMGEGDHSWTETVIMDEQEYLKHELRSSPNDKKKKNKAEFLDFDNDDTDLQGPFKVINNESDE